MKRLLVVPFNYSDRFRLRSFEFAVRWVPSLQVYVWRWEWLSQIRGSGPTLTKARRFRAAIADLFRRIRVIEGPQGLRLVDAPFLHPTLLRALLGLEGAIRVARWFNTWQLRRVVCRVKADRLLLSSVWFDVPKGLKIPVFYDVIDWFNEGELSHRFLQREMKRFRALLSRTSANFVVSEPLVRKLAADLAIASRYLPNGVDVRAVRGVSRVDLDGLRQKLALQNAWVLGYIGNHDEHAGLDFLLEVFTELRQLTRDAALLVVGPYDAWRNRLQITSGAPIRFTGPLPPSEIPVYCNLQDIAVHPCEKSEFRDYALPLKVIEASAARKYVLSTDLLSLRDLGFPNVLLAERTTERWVPMLRAARRMSWQSEWDDLIRPFDWALLAKKCADWMDEEGVTRA